MNVLSTFSGIGGLDKGLQDAGWNHVGFCEGGGDPNGTKEERRQWATGQWRRTVLAYHWPGVPIRDDVRDVGVDAIQDAREGRNGQRGLRATGRGRRAARADWQQGTVDLLCGGFPCQDLSVAGQRRGLAGNRSGLFFEFARVAGAFRPPWLLVENVPGLLSSNGGRDFGIVLGTLADLGYGLAWRIVDSRFFGVPQRRRRVFIVGALADGDPAAAARRAGEVLAVGSRCPRHPATRGEAREDVAVASLSGLGTGGPDDNDGQAGRLVIPALTTRAGNTQDDQQTGQLVAGPLGGGNNGTGRRSEDDPNLVVSASVRRLTPTECERLQGLPDNWTNPDGTAPDSRRYAALGDAVTAPVGEWIGSRILTAHRNAKVAA